MNPLEITLLKTQSELFKTKAKLNEEKVDQMPIVADNEEEEEKAVLNYERGFAEGYACGLGIAANAVDEIIKSANN